MDSEYESGAESGWESDGRNDLRLAAKLGQQLLKQKQDLQVQLDEVLFERDVAVRERDDLRGR